MTNRRDADADAIDRRKREKQRGRERERERLAARTSQSPESRAETKEKPRREVGVRFLGRELRPIGTRWAPWVGGDSSAPTGDVITRGRVRRCSLAPPGALFPLIPVPDPSALRSCPFGRRRRRLRGETGLGGVTGRARRVANFVPECARRPYSASFGSL